MDLPEIGWLPWRQALVLAALLAAFSMVISLVQRRTVQKSTRLASVSFITREAALVLVLYAVWQYVGSMTVSGLDQAQATGLWLAELQSTFGWPSEFSIQQVVIGNDAVISAADWYYRYLHVPVFVVTLGWILLFRRVAWPFTRTTIAVLTGLCLLIQLKPVAPPRLLPELGIIDTAAVNGRSVYALIPGANEYAAMPSVHVAWACAVALIIIIAARSRWRWLALAYPLVTSYVVVVTGNHFIIDGVVAVLLLGIAVSVAMLIPSQRPPSRSLMGNERQYGAGSGLAEQCTGDGHGPTGAQGVIDE